MMTRAVYSTVSMVCPRGLCQMLPALGTAVPGSRGVQWDVGHLPSVIDAHLPAYP